MAILKCNIKSKKQVSLKSNLQWHNLLNDKLLWMIKKQNVKLNKLRRHRVILIIGYELIGAKFEI